MNRIKELRLSFNLTQYELAYRIGLNQTAIGKYERGELEPSISTLKKLSEIFECSIDYIIGYSDDFGVISIHSQKEKPALALSQDEQKIINDYRSLPPDLKHRAAAYMEKLVELGAEEQQTHFSTSNNRINGKKVAKTSLRN